jgi:hypothetical protein
LQNLPADMGVAIVIVNHITKMPTQLHEILPRFTTMPVDLITKSLLIIGFIPIGMFPYCSNLIMYLSSLKIVIYMFVKESFV